MGGVLGGDLCPGGGGHPGGSRSGGRPLLRQRVRAADRLRQVAACLNSPVYESGVRRFVDEGMPFAAARQEVVRGILGPERSALLSTPNNNLGVEYLRALDRMGSAIRPVTVRREGAPHDSLLVGETPPEFLSATQLRAFLEAEDWRAAEPYLPGGGAEVLRRSWGGMPGLRRVERGLLARLRTHDRRGLGRPSGQRSGGGPAPPPGAGREAVPVPGGVFPAGQAPALDPGPAEAAAGVGLSGLTRADRPDAAPLSAVLGFNARGQELLKAMKGTGRPCRF